MANRRYDPEMADTQRPPTHHDDSVHRHDVDSVHRHDVDSEVGRLRTVMLHRPGPELKRLTPRNNDKLLFDGIPWVGRAQDEHDAFAQALRDHGVEVLYLADLLETALEAEPAREETIAAVLRDPRLGEALHRTVDRPGDHPDGRARARGDGARRRPGLPVHGPPRLRHRPAAEPAVHP
jgi:hypothetical protein